MSKSENFEYYSISDNFSLDGQSNHGISLDSSSEQIDNNDYFSITSSKDNPDLIYREFYMTPMSKTEQRNLLINKAPTTIDILTKPPEISLDLWRSQDGNIFDWELKMDPTFNNISPLLINLINQLNEEDQDNLTTYLLTIKPTFRLTTNEVPELITGDGEISYKLDCLNNISSSNQSTNINKPYFETLAMGSVPLPNSYILQPKLGVYIPKPKTLISDISNIINLAPIGKQNITNSPHIRKVAAPYVDLTLYKQT